MHEGEGFEKILSSDEFYQRMDWVMALAYYYRAVID
jgi:hypothetical protein